MMIQAITTKKSDFSDRIFDRKSNFFRQKNDFPMEQPTARGRRNKAGQEHVPTEYNISPALFRWKMEAIGILTDKLASDGQKARRLHVPQFLKKLEKL